MKRTVSILAVPGLLVLACLACGGGGGGGGGNADPKAACTDLCTTSGFTAGTAEVYPHELNCFCEGGAASARVTAAACTQTCKDLDWSEGEAFAAHACQCD